MIFDKYNLPRDQGATDWNDSARLAGIMVLFDHPQAKNIPLQEYVNLELGQYRRHPKQDEYDFSRDQAVCLWAGLYIDELYDLVRTDWITGKDILTPSVKGHFARCAGGAGSWFQNLWLKLDILWNAKFQPMVEPNQLICMCVVAGPEYVKLWTSQNKVWKEAIREYWSNWRGESDLAELMIKKLENYG